MVNEGSEDQINENQSQQEVEQDWSRTRSDKSKEAIMIRNICSSHYKRFPDLIPNTIYNHCWLFNQKIANSRKKGSEKFYNYKRYWLEIWEFN